MNSEQIEALYVNNGVVKSGLLLLQPDIAIEMVKTAHSYGIRILGVDAFIISNTSIQPSMDNSIDLTTSELHGSIIDSWEYADNFLRRYLDSTYVFEIILE